MDFSLSDEQQQLRRTVREFAEGEIAPHVMEWDEASAFSHRAAAKAGRPGFAAGILFPEEYGGAGFGYVEYATAIEELSRVDGSVGSQSPRAIRFARITFINTEMKRKSRKYLAPLWRAANISAAWGLTEPGAGSDASGRARPQSKTTVVG